jgi:hypothetical protein
MYLSKMTDRLWLSRVMDLPLGWAFSPVFPFSTCVYMSDQSFKLTLLFSYQVPLTGKEIRRSVLFVPHGSCSTSSLLFLPETISEFTLQ